MDLFTIVKSAHGSSFLCFTKLHSARPAQEHALGRLLAAGLASLRRDAQFVSSYTTQVGVYFSGRVRTMLEGSCRGGPKGQWQRGPTLAKLCGEGLQRWGVVGDAESVHLTGEHAVCSQLGNQR